MWDIIGRRTLGRGGLIWLASLLIYVGKSADQLVSPADSPTNVTSIVFNREVQPNHSSRYYRTPSIHPEALYPRGTRVMWSQTVKQRPHVTERPKSRCCWRK